MKLKTKVWILILSSIVFLVTLALPPNKAKAEMYFPGYETRTNDGIPVCCCPKSTMSCGCCWVAPPIF